MSEEVKQDTSNSNRSSKKKASVKRNVPITMDNSVEEVVKLSKDEGVTMFFDPNSFLELPSEVVDELGFYSAQSYFQAKQVAENKAKARENDRPLKYKDIQFLDPLSHSPIQRIKLRERRGFHQSWKRPDEIESAKEMGYRVIRKPNPKKEHEEPGKETGEVVELLDGEGKVEQIGVEIEEDIHNKHLNAIKAKSEYLRKGTVESLKETAERESRGAIKVKDFSNDDGPWIEG